MSCLCCYVCYNKADSIILYLKHELRSDFLHADPYGARVCMERDVGQSLADKPPHLFLSRAGEFGQQVKTFDVAEGIGQQGKTSKFLADKIPYLRGVCIAGAECV